MVITSLRQRGIPVEYKTELEEAIKIMKKLKVPIRRMRQKKEKELKFKKFRYLTYAEIYRVI